MITIEADIFLNAHNNELVITTYYICRGCIAIPGK